MVTALEQLPFKALTEALEVIEEAVAFDIELLFAIDHHDITISGVLKFDVAARVGTAHEFEVDLENFTSGQVFAVFNA
jgi:hypothetical protein